MKRKNWQKALFGLYGLVLLWLLFLQRLGGGWEVWINWRPLRTIRGFLWVLAHDSDGASRRYAWINLLGNLVLFLPWGLWLPMLREKMRKFGPFLLVTAATVLAVELTQYLTRLGVCDVDDLILNLTGAVAGWLIWHLGRKIGAKKQKIDTKNTSRT